MPEKLLLCKTKLVAHCFLIGREIKTIYFGRNTIVTEKSLSVNKDCVNQGRVYLPFLMCLILHPALNFTTPHIPPTKSNTSRSHQNNFIPYPTTKIFHFPHPALILSPIPYPTKLILDLHGTDDVNSTRCFQLEALTLSPLTTAEF